MATTAAGTPYVESSDLVASYPGVSLALANHIDTIGKVLQVVRATDSTSRSTTSASFVDANLSVTITPQRTDSTLILILNVSAINNISSGTDTRSITVITDSSNNLLTGPTGYVVGTLGTAIGQFGVPLTIMTQVASASLAARTYKARFRSLAAPVTAIHSNNDTPGQMYAIEVAA